MMAYQKQGPQADLPSSQVPAVFGRCLGGSGSALSIRLARHQRRMFKVSLIAHNVSKTFLVLTNVETSTV